MDSDLPDKVAVKLQIWRSRVCHKFCITCCYETSTVSWFWAVSWFPHHVAECTFETLKKKLGKAQKRISLW